MRRRLSFRARRCGQFQEFHNRPVDSGVSLSESDPAIIQLPRILVRLHFLRRGQADLAALFVLAFLHLGRRRMVAAILFRVCNESGDVIVGSYS